MKSIVKTLTFFMALVVIAMALYGVWFWVLQPMGVAPHLPPQEVEVFNRIVFCGYFALFAVLGAGHALVYWSEKRPGAFLASLLAVIGSVILGVVFYLHADELGVEILAFGVPMFLAIVFYFLRPFKKS